jgi:hypothetical protein
MIEVELQWQKYIEALDLDIVFHNSEEYGFHGTIDNEWMIMPADMTEGVSLITRYDRDAYYDVTLQDLPRFVNFLRGGL